MKKLMDIDMVDIIPFNKGIIVARKDTLSSGTTKVSFFTYDVKLERPTASTRSAYLLNKFGENFEKIATSVGFNEYITFYRAFKKFVGMSPDDYRKKIKHENIVSIWLKEYELLEKKIEKFRI
jgi:AraC-like DNA-binding protein